MNAFDIIQFFYNKEEHYPVSDKFMERYQQLSGGYLDFARMTGHCVCKNLHEPNQKWHLFESWLLQTAAGNKEKPLEEIQVKGFKCPELLLWMAEALGEKRTALKKAVDTAMAFNTMPERCEAYRKAIPFDRIKALVDNPQGWRIDPHKE